MHTKLRARAICATARARAIKRLGRLESLGKLERLVPIGLSKDKYLDFSTS